MNTKLILVPTLFLFLLMFIGCTALHTLVNGRKVEDQNSRLTQLTSFSMALSSRKYKKAAEMLIVQEQKKILDRTGNLYDGMDGRLSQLRLSTLVNDTNVRIINGKISGIYEKLPMLQMGPPIKKNNEPPTDTSSKNIALTVEKDSGQRISNLYLPPAISLEEKTSKEFINYINMGDWKTAMDMLTDYEREYLSNKLGSMKAEFKREFQNLTSEEWKSFFLYRGKLSGTLKWLGLGQFGKKISG